MCARARARLGVFMHQRGRVGVYVSACENIFLFIPHEEAHAPECLVWPLWLHNIFLHYLIKGIVFVGGKKALNIKCVF